MGCNYSKKNPPKPSIDSVAYLGIVYMRMDYTELLAGLARTQNPKYYGKYEDTVTQLDLFCVRWIKRSQNPFDWKSSVHLKIQFLTVITRNYVGELWAAVLKGLSHTVLSILCFCFTLYLDSLSSPSIIKSHAADLLAWEYCFFPFTQLIIRREKIHKHTIGRLYW